MRSDSNATPEMLRWAREKSGFTVEEVAQLEKLSLGTLLEWEEGIELPTHAQLEKLSKRYKFPMMVFYLEEPPPQGFTVVRDRRSLVGTAAQAFSPQFRATMRRIQEKQAWAAAYIESEPDAQVELVGSIETATEARLAGRLLREILGISIEDQVACSSPYDAWRLWQERCENAGIFVFTFSRIAIQECRGFAIAERIAPVAAVRNRSEITSGIV